jgi:hypothetical protein
VILELYLLSLLVSVIGGEGSAVTDWAEQEMIEGRRELTLWEGRRGLQGKRVARGEKMVACMTARGGKGLKKGFLAAQCVWTKIAVMVKSLVYLIIRDSQAHKFSK